ncbi:hypothetical protein B0H13DRAFT_1890665 [Mycena leptocephala]|nr:hypothetical protein B0H13DRAFT_1890665 [Mycena leptocephala]
MSAETLFLSPQYDDNGSGLGTSLREDKSLAYPREAQFRTSPLIVIGVPCMIFHSPLLSLSSLATSPNSVPWGIVKGFSRRLSSELYGSIEVRLGEWTGDAAQVKLKKVQHESVPTRRSRALSPHIARLVTSLPTTSHRLFLAFTVLQSSKEIWGMIDDARPKSRLDSTPMTAFFRERVFTANESIPVPMPADTQACMGSEV